MNSPSTPSLAGKTLAGQPAGSRFTIRSIVLPRDVRQRLMEMGLTPGSECTVVRYAPLGDPMEIFVCGYSLALRRTEALGINVEPVSLESL